MKNEDIVILSSDDWGWKTSKYQLSTRFARDNKVLFVSSVGFRSPTVSKHDLSRIVNKLTNFFKGVRCVAPSLYVLTPLVIPFRKNPLVNLINSGILKLQLRGALRSLGMKEPYLFVFSQNWLESARQLPKKKTIYYCVDEHSGFKGLDAETFRRNDQEMAQLADVIICSSQKLEAQKKQINPATYYVSHGVNFELFSRVVHDHALAVAADVADLRGPVLGFWGHISHDWVDSELLKKIAGARPDWTILLIGKYSMSPEEFSAFANIRVTGERDYENLPAYCKAISVGIIPFVKSTLTDNCNPLKLYEYLSSGLPVVSTDIPEVRKHARLVHIATTYDEFLSDCETALAERSAEQQKLRSDAMAHCSWDSRVDEIYRIISDYYRDGRALPELRCPTS
jgi:glycosyltransferase involved in cell wall biosynthesis